MVHEGPATSTQQSTCHPTSPAICYALSMKNRLLLLVVAPLALSACNYASWGSKSGWEFRNDPDAPDFEVQERETEGSYTPISENEGDER